MDIQRQREVLSGASYGESAACKCASNECSLCTANFGAGALDLDSISHAMPMGTEITTLGRQSGLGGIPTETNPMEILFIANGGLYAPFNPSRPSSGPTSYASTSDIDYGPNGRPDWSDTEVYRRVSRNQAPPINAAIYTSAGGTDDDGHSCDFNSPASCTLYKVTLKIDGLDVLYKVEIVRASETIGGEGNEETWGFYEPSVSPDGNKVAYTSQSNASESTRGRIDVDAKGIGPVTVATGSRTEDNEFGIGPPLYPAWFGNDVLLFTSAQGGYTDGVTDDQGWAVFGMNATSSSGTLEIDEHQGFLGPDTTRPLRQVVTGGLPWATKFSDSGVKQPSQITNFSQAAREMKLVTQGSSTQVGFGSVGDTIPAKPRVHALGSRNPITTEEFILGENVSGQPITEAHHGAWDPKGEKVMVYVHEPTEIVDEANSNIQFRLLYIYSQQSSGFWGSPRRAFDPLGAKELDEQFNTSDATLYPRRCDLYFYKYAEFCRYEDYVLSTLFCTAEDYFGTAQNDSYSNRVVLGSRVMVTRRSTGVHWDITALIEDWYDHNRGELRGYKGTCASSEDD